MASTDDFLNDDFLNPNTGTVFPIYREDNDKSKSESEIVSDDTIRSSSTNDDNDNDGLRGTITAFLSPTASPDSDSSSLLWMPTSDPYFYSNSEPIFSPVAADRESMAPQQPSSSSSSSGGGGTFRRVSLLVLASVIGSGVIWVYKSARKKQRNRDTTTQPQSGGDNDTNRLWTPTATATATAAVSDNAIADHHVVWVVPDDEKGGLAQDRALEELETLFPQYNRVFLRRELNDRGSLQAATEAILYGALPATATAPYTLAMQQHESHIGKRVAKFFGTDLHFGTIREYSCSDAALTTTTTTTNNTRWNITYDDDDREDLDTAELHQAMELYEDRKSQDRHRKVNSSNQRWR